MANSFTADFPEIWAREQQEIFYKENIAMKIADTSFKGQMSFGDTLNRPYRSTNAVQAYVRGTDITINDKTDTNEQLSVNRQFATGFYMDDFDKIQSNYDLISKYAQDDGILLSNQVDADVLGEYGNATSTVDDGTLGGTAGNAIALTTSNVALIVGAAKRKLRKQNIPLNDLFGAISPEFEDILIQYGAGRDTVMGDGLNKEGAIMNFYGFNLYGSNQLAGSAVLTMAVDPTNTNTVVIDGITFTAVTTIGTTAGNFLVGSDADTSRANLAALITNPTVTSANQVALSAENAKKVANTWTATNDDTANTLTVVVKGVGALTVSETLADAGDIWTAVKQVQHNLFGRKGAVTLVMQSDARVQIKDEPKKFGKNILNGVLYGVKTFADGAKQLVDVQIKSSTF